MLIIGKNMASKTNYNPEIKKVVDSILLKIPFVVPGKMFGYPAYYINRKLFACIYSQGVGIKVPEAMVKKLVNKPGMIYFQPLGRPKMKEWIQINRENPSDYLRDVDIFKISMSFVSSINSFHGSR
jgi:hypothetical protein